MHLPVLLVNEMVAGGKQHRGLLVAFKLSVSQHLLAPSTETWTMQMEARHLMWIAELVA